MSISVRLKTFLDENQIPYSVVTHTTAYTAQGTAATLQISGKRTCQERRSVDGRRNDSGRPSGAESRESGSSPVSVTRSKTHGF